MAALGASDVSYTPMGRSLAPNVVDDNKRAKKIKAVFGDGSKTYPAGGIPLSGLSKWGFPNVIDDVIIMDGASGNGYVYKWDAVNNKLRIYNAMPAHSHDLLLKDAIVADGATTRVNAGADKLGANTGADITVSGGGTDGGVQDAAAAAGVEVDTSFAPASTTVYLLVHGH